MSFLRDYLTWAGGNEAPKMFHLWSGLTCVSACVPRTVWLPYGARAIYPNLYTLLVGEAGNGKSIAMYFTKRLLASVYPGDTHEIPISANVETPAGLWSHMMGKPKAIPVIPSPVMRLVKHPDGHTCECHPMLIMANEFVNFISTDPENWTTHLNDIYDQDVFRYRTINSGDNLLHGPYISILGGLTTDFAQSLHKAKIISSGFARRTLFQYGERDVENPQAELEESEDQKRAFIRCINHLRSLKTAAGPFHRNPETKAYWKTWYDDNSHQVTKRNPALRSWYLTKPDQVLRLAMLLALCDGLVLEITSEHFRMALEYLDILEKDLYKVFGGVGRNELAEVALRIFSYISTLPEPITGKVLMARMWKDLPNKRGLHTELKDCLEHLSSTGQLSIYSITTDGLPPDFLIATPEIMTKFRQENQHRINLQSPATSSGSNGVGPSQRLPEVPTESHRVALPSVDPSKSPEQAATSDSSAEVQDVVQSAPSAAIVPPPMVVK